MKRLNTLGLILGGTMLAAACGEKATTDETAETAPTTTNAAKPMGNMGGMDTGAEAKAAKGSGTVTAIDTAAGRITLDHGPIPEAGWPAMTMAFDVKPDVLKGITVGDKVAFDLALKGGGGEVTAIYKQ